MRSAEEQERRECWIHGFQQAIEVLRHWADEMAPELHKAAILHAADMMEATKPHV